MVLLGGPGLHQRDELGDDLRIEDAGVGELLVRLERGLALVFVVVEDDRAVLGAEVGSLTVQGRRVVAGCRPGS